MKGLCAVFTLVVTAGVCVNGQGVVPGIQNRCFEPAEPGICRAFIPSFYFNPLSGSCDCFIYGGCRGNNNRYGTLSECMKTCSVRPELQFNTPACARYFNDKNPLVSFPMSPHEPAEIRQITAAPQQPQPTQATEIVTATDSPQTESTQLTQTEKPAPKNTTPAPKPAVEEEGESSNPLSSRGIASIVIGSSGVRPGILSIGQPVVISFNKPKQTADEGEE